MSEPAGELPDEIWTTRDGRKIAVGDMDESHVRNALRMMIRRHNRMQRTVKELLALKQALKEARDHDFDLDMAEMVGWDAQDARGVR